MVQTDLRLRLHLPSPLVELVDERLGTVQVLLKRDDLIHREVSGNKWRKLKYLMADVRSVGATTLLTFGGAYSNHVRAIAALGRTTGLRTIGVIRGDERPYNAVLASSIADGMQLHYLDRATYRRKSEHAVISSLRSAFGDFYLVPEGGTTVHALPGCAEIVAEIEQDFDLVVCPVGTGGTIAGIASGLGAGRRVLGISVLKGARSLDDEVTALHRSGMGHDLDNWTIDHRFHHGGFARRTPELDWFIDEFKARHDLRLDHVYVAKMMFGLFAMIAAGEIEPATVVVAVVTGRVQDDTIRSSSQKPDLIV